MTCNRVEAPQENQTKTHVITGGKGAVCSSGAFAKLRQVTFSFVMSVCLSVRLEQVGCHWTDCHEIDIRVFFENLTRKL